VVAVRTEREPNRYEPLNETHRRVAEEEEKRRLAEQEEARSAQAQPEPEPQRPGPDPRPQRPEAEPDYSPEAIEARLAAEKERLGELVKQGRIDESDMNYRFSRFDQNLRTEIEQAGMSPPTQHRDGSGNRRDELAAEPEHGGAQSPQRAEDAHDQPRDQARDDPSQRAPETRIEREAQAAEYEITGRGEVSDARAARLALLRSIDRDIERESRENEGKGPDLDHDSGDHSR
jgi:hypothetical protein